MDIQPTSDVGGGYNVGWIQLGEWLAYEVEVGESGEYAITARVAADSTEEKSFHLTLDSQPLANARFTSSTGWQNYVDIGLGTVRLPAGRHLLQFEADSLGFNLNYFDFSLADRGPGRLMPVGAATQSVSGQSAAETWDKLEQDLGVVLPIRRSFSAGFPTEFSKTPAAIDVSRRDSVYSFKAPWTGVAAGNYDDSINALVDSIPQDHKVWLCYFHEPENDSGSAADYRRAFARFAQVVRARRGNKPITVTQILMGWTWQSNSGRDPDDWVVPEAEVVGIDAYGGQCGNRSLTEVFGRAVTWLKARDRRWAVAETGCEEKPGESQKKVAWTQQTFQYLFDNGAEFATWWDSKCDDGCDYRIRSSAAATAAFAEVVRQYAFGQEN